MANKFDVVNPKYLRDNFYRSRTIYDPRHGRQAVVRDVHSFQFIDLAHKLDDVTYLKHIIRPDEHQKPWLISMHIYGSFEYWWVIAEINAVVNPFTDFPAGREIAVPNLSAIETLYDDFRRASRKGQVEDLSY